MIPIFAASECYVVWPPTGRPVNTAMIDEMLDSSKIEVMVVAPSLLEDIVHSPESLDKLSGVERVVTGGGKHTLWPFQ